MNILNKFKNYLISKITSRILKEINKELSKQNEDILILLKEEFAIAREQSLLNTNQIKEISKQLDVLARMIRGERDLIK